MKVTCAVRLETAFYGNSFVHYPFSATTRSLALIAEGLDIPSGGLSARFDPSIWGEQQWRVSPGQSPESTRSRRRKGIRFGPVTKPCIKVQSPGPCQCPTCLNLELPYANFATSVSLVFRNPELVCFLNSRMR